MVRKYNQDHEINESIKDVYDSRYDTDLSDPLTGKSVVWGTIPRT